MLRELSGFSESVTFRILVAVWLFIVVVRTALPDLRQGPANIWELVIDVGTIAGLVLVLFSLWSPAERYLTRIGERYHPYLVAGFALFFLTWSLYLLSTGVDDLGTFVTALVAGLAFLVGFARWYFSNDTPGSP